MKATAEPGRSPRSAVAGNRPARRRLPVLGGLLPIRANQIPADLLGGLTLAALGIPEVLGYAKIAGMPVVTGLYTILLPTAVFAVLGSSRHLVVGADSATAAMTAAGIAGLAAAGSAHYVALAGLVALLAGIFLLVARLIRLGFLAAFLSRTVLVGFLTGVGVQVAAGQVGEMLGLHPHGSSTIPKLVDTARHLGHVHGPTVAVSAAVIAVVLGCRFLAHRIPGALIAVVAAIVASRVVHLQHHGVAVLGAVPSGMPSITVPWLHLHDIVRVAGTAAAVFVVVLAQSSATSRAYAAKYGEPVDENEDFIGLAGANVAAAFTGTFVVNGSPTKTQMVDGAGGRSQLSQLTTAGVVLLVLLFLTGPLATLPLAVLAAIVFLIGIELIDIRGLRAILAVRRDEFLIASLTAVAVVVVGVEAAIVLAVVASVIDHLRISYAPHNTVLEPDGLGRWRVEPASPHRRTTGGLVVYRFAATLYYANAHRLVEEVEQFLADPKPPRWFCLDFAAIADVDYTGAQALRTVLHRLGEHSVQAAFSEVPDRVRKSLDRYGITGLLGAAHIYGNPEDVLTAYERAATGGDATRAQADPGRDPGGSSSSPDPAARASAVRTSWRGSGNASPPTSPARRHRRSR